MPSLNAQFKQYRLKEPFTISRYSKVVQDAVVVTLEHEGVQGYGECTTNPYYLFNAKDALKRIARSSSAIEKIPLLHPIEYWKNVQMEFPHHPFIQCAIDEAYWDLYGKLHQKTTRQILELSNKPGPPTSLTLSMGSKDELLHRIERNPWPILKIKSGKSHSIKDLAEIARSVPDKMCIDANASWTMRTTEMAVKSLPADRVLFIEQPLAAGQDQSLRSLKDQGIIIAADESIQNREDLAHCASCYSAVNVKLMKCGGITPALSILQLARQIGLKTMIGCMTESSIGISAAAQLISLADFVDLDGAMLLHDDEMRGVTWNNAAHVVWSDAYGNGVTQR